MGQEGKKYYLQAFLDECITILSKLSNIGMVDAKKTTVYGEFIICLYCYTLETNFRFQLKLYDGCFKVFLEKCSSK